MNTYQKELHRLDTIINDWLVHQQVEQIDKIIACLDKKQVIKKTPIELGITPDVLEDISFEKGISEDALEQMNNLLNNFRSFISRRYGIWSLPNLEAAQAIKKAWNIQTGLEVMSGNSCWSKALSEVGVKMTATDSMAWAKTSETGSQAFYPTQALGARQAIEKYNDVDLVICCWAPNFGSGDLEVLEAFRRYTKPSAHLIFIGEKDGATNTPAFWQAADNRQSREIKEINSHFGSFDFIEEKVYEIK